MTNELVNLVKSVTEVSALLAQKDARIKELEAQVQFLNRAGFYPFNKMSANEKPSEWHKISDDYYWRYITSFEVRCVQYRNRVRQQERFNTIELPIDVLYRVGALHYVPKQHFLNWAAMLNNPD